MRTLVRLHATSILLIGLALTPALAAAPAVDSEPPQRLGPQSEPQLRIVRVSSQPRPGGGHLVHYNVLERVQPLLAVNEEGVRAPDVVVSAEDFVTVSYDAAAEGWVSIGTLTVEQYGPAAPATQAEPGAGTPSDAEPTEALALAIAPVRPDPVHGRALVVGVTLPGAGPARIDVLDVMGRRVASRDLGSLGAGRHAVDLGAGQRFAPGVYMLRLTRAGEARTARVTVTF